MNSTQISADIQEYLVFDVDIISLHTSEDEDMLSETVYLLYCIFQFIKRVLSACPPATADLCYAESCVTCFKDPNCAEQIEPLTFSNGGVPLPRKTFGIVTLRWVTVLSKPAISFPSLSRLSLSSCWITVQNVNEMRESLITGGRPEKKDLQSVYRVNTKYIKNEPTKRCMYNVREFNNIREWNQYIKCPKEW